MSYLVIGLCGALLSMGWWFGVQRVFSSVPKSPVAVGEPVFKGDEPQAKEEERTSPREETTQKNLPNVSAPGGIAIGRDNLGTAIVNPPVNPNAPVVTYDFNGARRTTSPGVIDLRTGEEYGDFQKMAELQEKQAWPALLELAESRIKKTPTWLTPYLYSGVALANMGRYPEAIIRLEYVTEQAGGNEAFKDAPRILGELRRLRQQ